MPLEVPDEIQQVLRIAALSIIGRLGVGDGSIPGLILRIALTRFV